MFLCCKKTLTLVFKLEFSDISKYAEMNSNEKRKSDPSVELPTPYDKVVNDAIQEERNFNNDM